MRYLTLFLMKFWFPIDIGGKMAKVFAKGLGTLQVVSGIFFVRILSVFLVQTWYVPDEYWQSLEVAHKQVFGYGALTWEWQKGIRSYLYPSLFAVLYTILKYTGLDYPEAVVLVPRLYQALLSTAADYSFYKWTGGRKWALFLVLTSWFWFYTSGRTLIQTTETSLVAIALSLFPFKDGVLSQYEKENPQWIWVACVCVFLRPTSAPLWLVLGAYNLLTTNRSRPSLVLSTYLPIALICGSALVALDSFCHGSLIITPWEFFRFNVLHDVSSFYGTHPWHWYLTRGLPAVLGAALPPALWAAGRALRRPAQHRAAALLLAAAALHVALYSFIPHKEFRFMMPLLPIFLYLAQLAIVPWSRKAKKWQLYAVAGALLASNAAPAAYFGGVHQAGALRVMPLLREALAHRAHDNRTDIAFLMPCHSTPLYSHLHTNVSTRYLNCDPPAVSGGAGGGGGGGTHEAEAFYMNPLRWWRQQYAARRPPALLVMFDVLRGRLEPALAQYKLLHDVPHTQFPEGEVSERVLVFQREDKPPKPQTDEVV